MRKHSWFLLPVREMAQIPNAKSKGLGSNPAGNGDNRVLNLNEGVGLDGGELSEV